jgi:hypothetical protein
MALVRRFYEEIDKGDVDALDELVAADYLGDKIVTRLTSFGKHEGDLPEAPKTGNDLKITSIIADSKLVEKWAEKDVLGFLQRIGVMPSQQHSRASEIPSR